MMDDETLTLYYYGDGLSDAQVRRIESALAADAALAARYAALRAELDRLRGWPAQSPAPDAVGRWHAALSTAAGADAQSAAPPPRATAGGQLAWAMAAALALAIGLGAGSLWRKSPPASPATSPIVATQPAALGAPPVVRAVQAHLVAGQTLLARLPGADAGERTQRLAMIVAQNRLHAQAAQREGDAQLARVLRAFEPVLLRLASSDIDAADAELLRAQLRFELGAMLTKLEYGASEPSIAL